MNSTTSLQLRLVSRLYRSPLVCWTFIRLITPPAPGATSSFTSPPSLSVCALQWASSRPVEHFHNRRIVAETREALKVELEENHRLFARYVQDFH
jgi:hypothetical protein